MEIDKEAMLREAIDSMKRDSSMQTETIKEKLKKLVDTSYMKVLDDVEERIKLCLKDTNKHKEKGMPQDMDWKAEALGYKTSLECIQRTREKFVLCVTDEGGQNE